MTIPESHLAQEAVAALVDGELTSGPAARAARHVSGCAQCRMAVEAQREAKDALHACSDVTVPGDLLSRLRAIPFTTDVPGPGSGPGALHAGPGQLTLNGASGAWSVPLDAPRPRTARPDQARWLRRGMAGAIAGLGLGVTTLALMLPAVEAQPEPAHSTSVAGPSPRERSEVVTPVVRQMPAEVTARAVNAGGPSVGVPGGTP